MQDRQWIPKELSDFTYFSERDLWHYIGVSDERLCEFCEVNDGMDMSGDILQGKFPDIGGVFEGSQFDDMNVVYPHVHPNCRCVLIRIAAPLEILIELGYK